jgi:outer membrane protein assembly factor BamB
LLWTDSVDGQDESHSEGLLKAGDLVIGFGSIWPPGERSVGFVRAYDPTNGTILWELRDSEITPRAAADEHKLVIAHLVAPAPREYFYRLQTYEVTTGKPLWQRRLPW